MTTPKNRIPVNSDHGVVNTRGTDEIGHSFKYMLSLNEITILLATILSLLILTIGIYEEIIRQTQVARQSEIRQFSSICDKPFNETWIPLRLELSYSQDCMQLQQEQ